MSPGHSRGFAVGTPIPPLDAHAISVSLPTWKANIGYQEGEKSVVDSMVTGYPRFTIHRSVARLAAIFLREAGKADENCLVFLTARYASVCKAFMLAPSPKFPSPNRARQVRFSISSRDVSATAIKSVDMHVVFFHNSRFRLAKQFWQHTGFGISSRLAQRYLDLLTRPGISSDSANQFQSITEHSGAESLTDSFPPPTNDKILHLETNQLEEIFVDREAAFSASSAKAALRNRIGGLLTPDSSNMDPDLDRPHRVGEEDVFLYPTGMAAIWHAHQLVVALRPEENFPYTDTLKILEKWGPGCYFFGNGPERAVEELEALLASSSDVRPVSAVFCEFPSNPLLEAPRLEQLRALADEYDFLIVLDETIGNFANVAVLRYVDILVTSLSKFFSGSANVLGGSFVLNSRMRHYKALKAAQITSYVDTYFGEDSIVMESNSRDFALRMRTINANTEILCEFLRSRSLSMSPTNEGLVIKEIFYPKWTTRESYDICRIKRYPDGQAAYDNFGGLFSLTFVSSLASHTFFDALPCAKGPSLGTNFTLVCPYTILAHYAEREWAAEYGVDEDLVRVSVGLENPQELLAGFEFALRKAEEVIRRDHMHQH